MARQSRSADEGPGRRFKRRKRKRGKRGAVSQRRGRDKAVEGKDRQFRDRSERPGDRSKSKRSRTRRPVRRQGREGGDRDKRDFKPQTGRPGDGDRGRGPGRQQLGGIRDEINAIKQRREQFSQKRPEQVAGDRGFDPARLQEFQQGGAFQAGPPAGGPQGQPAPAQPTNLDQVNAYDAAPEYAQPQPAPAPGVQIGPGGVVGPQPLPAPQPDVAPAPGTVPGQPGGEAPFTPLDQPGPTAPPGIATDAYGKPVGVAPQPQPAPAPGYQPGSEFQLPQAPQLNPRAAGMDRFAQPPAAVGAPVRPEQPRV